MKRLIFILIAFFFATTTLMAQNSSKIVFEKSEHNFGNIQEVDGDASCEFKFTNDGDAPLIITRATSSCGCTAPKYPKEPIAPGESGVISVTYHAKGRPGGFSRNVTIYTNNADEKIVLRIVGNVIPEVKK